MIPRSKRISRNAAPPRFEKRQGVNGETRLSRFALSDRDDIFSYIEAENPRAAVHVDEQIADAARRLLDFPDSGRPGRVAGTRELVIPRAPYVAAYFVDGETVRICACFTARRCGPTNLQMTIDAGLRTGI
ncbi:addiction module RelE/StbE family toxin [Bradyrhizobium elkanii]|jgi:toxin ParE1/3/4|nr:addiction module RelE/StbE family toxin [Bradyrhizobium elkanii]MCS3564594.1 addiction module RelE/StbE family toxin [Bradyrhizobium elkanii]MCW2145574.1 addiction module RelE/StbE family toxin [Bradyrhizobium elkanii]MCW2355608.1 addiction module RelE/StbE family toxin [Bradyrhizobium elkanii]MCW2378401.1 addiction module RelE/StbE family toxin [Bradyrhizobium elkanii]